MKRDFQRDIVAMLSLHNPRESAEPATYVLARVRREDLLVDDGRCWNWQGMKTGRYGLIGNRVMGQALGLPRKLHRAAYQLWVGELMPGLTIDHLCRNTLCCNPRHLEQCSEQENKRRANTLDLRPRARASGGTVWCRCCGRTLTLAELTPWGACPISDARKLAGGGGAGRTYYLSALEYFTAHTMRAAPSRVGSGLSRGA